MKRSRATFLTKKELCIFEDTYQSLKLFPGFRMANIFCHKTREYYGVYTQCARELYKELGCKGNLLIIALI